MPTVGDPFGATDSFVVVHEPPYDRILGFEGLIWPFYGFCPR